MAEYGTKMAADSPASTRKINAVLVFLWVKLFEVVLQNINKLSKDKQLFSNVLQNRCY